MTWPDWQHRRDQHRQPRRVDYTRPGFVRPADPEPCDICGGEASILDGVVGARLCQEPACFHEAWDRAFPDGAA